MNVDGNEVVNRLGEQIKNLTIENVQLQVSVEALMKERINLLNEVDTLKRRNGEPSERLAEYEPEEVIEMQ